MPIDISMPNFIFFFKSIKQTPSVLDLGYTPIILYKLPPPSSSAGVRFQNLLYSRFQKVLYYMWPLSYYLLSFNLLCLKIKY